MDLWDDSNILPGYGWLFPLPGGSINLGAGLLNVHELQGPVGPGRVRRLLADAAPRWNVNR